MLKRRARGVRLGWVLAEPLTRRVGAAVGWCRVVLKTPQYGPSPNKPPPGFKAAEVVGPAGWHLHSFASTAHGLYKMFSRAGHYSSVMHPAMKAKALQHRQHCSEVRVRFPSPFARIPMLAHTDSRAAH